jgi:hypothetical protein
MLDLKALLECAELAQQLDCECEECKTPRNECARAVPELIGEIERLRESEVLCPACGTEWSLKEPARCREQICADRDRLREALKSIMTYYEIEYRQGDKAYQAAIIARRTLGEK